MSRSWGFASLQGRRNGNYPSGDSGEDLPKVFLTKEIQILAAMSFGFSAPEIAHKFHLAERTIRRKASILRLKFNARSDAELLAKATALGIVKPDLDSIAD